MGATQGVPLDRYIATRGPLDSKQTARLGVQVLRRLRAELDAPGRPPLVWPGRLVLRSGGAVAIRPAAGDDGRSIARTHPAYASPEEAQGIPGDRRSWFYSLGCTLHELLTGAPPYTGDPQTVLRAHIRSPIPDARDEVLDTDPALADALLDLLHKDPALRLADPDELEGRLRDVAAGTAASQPARSTANATARASRAPGRERGAPSRRGSSPSGARSAPARSRTTRRTRGSSETRRPVSSRRRSRRRADEESEEATRPAARRTRAWPLAWSGLAVGVVAALVVAFAIAGAADDAREEARGRIQKLEREVLSAREQDYLDKVEDEDERVRRAVAKAREIVADESVLREEKIARLRSLLDRHSQLPGSARIVVELDAIREPEEPVETVPAARAWAQAVAEAESLERRGRLAEAVARLRQVERELGGEHAQEIDARIRQLGEQIEERWNDDREEYEQLIAEDRFADALEVAQEALEYGDDAVRREARALAERAKAGLLATSEGETGGSGESGDEGPVLLAGGSDGEGSGEDGSATGEDPSGDTGDGEEGEDPFGDDPLGDDPLGDDPLGDDPFGDDPFGGGDEPPGEGDGNGGDDAPADADGGGEDDDPEEEPEEDF